VLAILPVESDAWPRLAAELNKALQKVQISGVDETRRLKVALEVVQTQIECLDATDACYTAAGKSLKVSQMLSAVLSKDKRTKGPRMTLVLFDVERGTLVRVVDRSYKKQDEAVKSVSEAVAEIAGPAGAAPEVKN
jgi:hypothetical protein